MADNDLIILKQYIEALDEASQTLEQAYLKKDIETLEKTKKFILEIQSKITIMLK